MKRMRWWILSTAVALSAVTQVRAEDASMTLADGTKFSFELVRSAGKSRTELASGVATSKGVSCRLLFESKRLRFFGYTVMATPLAGDRFRLEFGPLTPEVLERLAKDFRPEGRQLVGESLAIEYPPALEVHDDEPLMLELMVNPTTGEKLSDVIRVTRTTKPSPEQDRLVVKAAVLKVNGKALDSSGGASGRYVYFALPERGRFVVSTEAVNGYEFLPAELTDNRTIKFVVDGDAYEWTSAEPVVAITPVPERLWVWHDVAFEFNHPFGVGAFDALPHR